MILLEDLTTSTSSKQHRADENFKTHQPCTLQGTFNFIESFMAGDTKRSPPA